jgi:hypothetical protein
MSLNWGRRKKKKSVFNLNHEGNESEFEILEDEYSIDDEDIFAQEILLTQMKSLENSLKSEDKRTIRNIMA